MDHVLEVNHLSVRFGKVEVLSDLSFDLAKGSSLAARGESEKQFPWRMFRRKIALWRWERGVASRKNSGLQLAPWRALPAIRFMSG